MTDDPIYPLSAKQALGESEPPKVPMSRPAPPLANVDEDLQRHVEQLEQRTAAIEKRLESIRFEMLGLAMFAFLMPLGWALAAWEYFGL